MDRMAVVSISIQATQTKQTTLDKYFIYNKLKDSTKKLLLQKNLAKYRNILQYISV